jgi:beta-glucosidase
MRGGVSEPLAFPQDFTFGVATSAYQVEGGIDNDWAAWERSGRVKAPHRPGVCGAGHWERFFDDVELIRALGATAYRLSIEWARVEPERDRWDDAAWSGYRARLEALAKAGIRPIVTFHHFTHPRWFHAQTPWHEPSSLQAWGRYAKRCAELLDGLDVAVTTINEPNVFLLGGYLSGQMPPGLNDSKKAYAAAVNLIRAHVIARQAVRDRDGGRAVKVGIAQNVMAFAPRRLWNPFDQALSRLAPANYNHAMLEALATGRLRFQMPGLLAGEARIDGAERSTDFTGLNYYTRAHLRFLARPPFLTFDFVDKHRRGLTDIGWEDYPEGFGALLKEMRRYELPVWVTENGIDDRSGTRRPDYLYRHLKELLLARREGVDVTTYIHWSLLDNFEWLEGFGPRFGLYRVDFGTQERTPTPACEYFAKLARSRILTPPAGAEVTTS